MELWGVGSGGAPKLIAGAPGVVAFASAAWRTAEGNQGIQWLGSFGSTLKNAFEKNLFYVQGKFLAKNTDPKS